MSTIEPVAARKIIADNPDVLVVDVRTPGEFESAHIPGSINLPLEQVDAHLRRVVADAGGQMVLVCQGGTRAESCRRLLARAGHDDTLVLAGGLAAWRADGGAVVEGRRRWDLERQVRLVAGGIVAVAVLVSLWWPPARFLAGLIGAGLVFAAVSNTCAMGMLLSRLPYNRPAADFDIENSLRGLSRTPR